MAQDRDRENSYGGFQYRWNYDDYQKSLQRKRKKSAARGMRAFCLTAIFVFLLCTASLLVVLAASFVRSMILTLPTESHADRVSVHEEVRLICGKSTLVSGQRSAVGCEGLDTLLFQIAVEVEGLQLHNGDTRISCGERTDEIAA